MESIISPPDEHEVEKILKEINGRSATPRSPVIFTPFWLCRQMLSSVQALDGETLVVSNLEFIYVLMLMLGKRSMENVWFATSCEYKKRTAIEMGINGNKIIGIEYNKKQLFKTDMKFDVIISNPPYKGNLHLNFLESCYNMSKGYILFIHPSAWLLDEKRINKKSGSVRNLIRKTLKTVKLLNGNNIFKIKMFMPVCEILIDKNKNQNDKILVVDEINKTKELYDDIDSINKWNDQSIYPVLKHKILDLSVRDNFTKHKNKNEGHFFINLAFVRGNVNDGSDNLTKDDFYTLVPKDYKIELKPEKSKWGEQHDFWFSFATENEANNCLNFLKTTWAMFSLSIFKTSGHLNRGEMKSIPWLDWKRSWNDDDFSKLIDATNEEVEFVKKHIPNYYSV